MEYIFKKDENIEQNEINPKEKLVKRAVKKSHFLACAKIKSKGN